MKQSRTVFIQKVGNGKMIKAIQAREVGTVRKLCFPKRRVGPMSAHNYKQLFKKQIRSAQKIPSG